MTVNLGLRLKKLLNYQNEAGDTLLHRAVLRGNTIAVKFLLKEGIDPQICNHDGFPAIAYAENNPRIKKILLAHGAQIFDPLFTPLHRSVLYGKLKQVKKNIREDPKQLDSVDCNGWSPLFHAIKENKRCSINVLLSSGANPYLVDNHQRNIIDMAKNNGHHTPLSKELKQKVGLSSQDRIAIENSCLRILKEQFHLAKNRRKKLLVVLGEWHGHYLIYQIEKIVIKALQSLGIHKVLIESNLNSAQFPIDRYAKNKLNMHLIGVDKHPHREEASLVQRNEVMAQKINTLNEPAVLMTGTKHLQGLLTHKCSKINPLYYHIVPFNLSSILTKNHFASNPENAIQVNYSGFTDPRPVIRQWNTP